MKKNHAFSGSEIACQIFKDKYLRGPETTPYETIERVVTAISRAAITQKVFSDAEAKVFSDELKFILLNQKAAFNSPVWFNCGLFETYGFKAETENWAYNFNTKKYFQVGSAFERPQISACFIQSIEDRLLSIFELVKTEARLFKFGSGTGTNFSVLRARGEALSGGGVSSGLMAFLEVFDKAAQATKSGGITRRAAKMVVLDADHPEIEEFVMWKLKEERKALALIRGGYAADEAYETVSGQNSNNSVRVTDAFFKAVQKNELWSLRQRKSGHVAKEILAKDLFEKISLAAWECADPGLQFHDRIQDWHTCPSSGVIEASNPCSEYFFLNDSACNLSSVNLVKFIGQNGEFLFKDYLKTVDLLIHAQEVLVDYGSYPTEKIAENSHRFRPLGLGYSHLGGFFLQQGVAYGSDDSLAWTSLLTAGLLGQALVTSAKLAEKQGAFDGFDENKDSVLKVVHLHRKAWIDLKFSEEFLVKNKLKEIKQKMNLLFDEAVKLIERHGLRHAQLTAIAPTGTISLIMDCDTTGIEPEFSWLKQKKLVGGGVLDLHNNNLTQSWTRLGYSFADQAGFLRELKEKGSFLGSKNLRKEHQDIFLTAMRDPVVQKELSADAHLSVAASAQAFVSGGISKTVNLPKEATVEDVSKVYFEAWSKKLKSISIYRDGSKGLQPLETKDPSCEVCS